MLSHTANTAHINVVTPIINLSFEDGVYMCLPTIYNHLYKSMVNLGAGL